MDFLLQTLRDYNDPSQNQRPSMFWGQGTNDLIVDTNADFALVDNVPNLVQSMEKILVTARGANIFTPMYGSSLNSFVGAQLNLNELTANITTDLIDTLRIYQFINQANPDLNEQIDTLLNLNVSLITGVPGIQVSFQVITRAGLTSGSTIQVEG